jgi:hypothetical protein
MIRAIRMTQSLLLLTLVFMATVTQAQSESAYQIEVILFTQPSAQISGGRTPDFDWANEAVMLEETARSDVRKLDSTQHRLDREAGKLTAQGYQILMHNAWIQPADSRLTVAVHQGESLGDHYPIEAVVGLQRSADSLALDVKAWRHIAVRGQTDQDSTLVSEQLHQIRRLRLDEVHYLDHQSMGMLVRVSRR